MNPRPDACRPAEGVVCCAAGRAEGHEDST